MSVGKDAAVVALQGVHQELLSYSVEDVLLLRFWGKDAVEGKGMFFELNLAGGIGHSLLLAAGLDSHHYLDRVFRLRLLVIHFNCQV